MNEMLQNNAVIGPRETRNMTKNGLNIVQLLERSEDDQYIGLGNNGFENINLEGDDIPTIHCTKDVVINYAGDHISIENHTGNTSISCESAHDTDLTFSAVINIDDIIIQDIITDRRMGRRIQHLFSIILAYWAMKMRQKDIDILKTQRYLHQTKHSTRNTTRKRGSSHDWRNRGSNCSKDHLDTKVRHSRSLT